ncbi:MAG: hypothetical protein GY866_10025 [Proteobacteria bacterium]|nr:hypothetical protein [Pseudomonadota bacterium]
MNDSDTQMSPDDGILEETEEKEKTVSIKVSEKRFQKIKSGIHFEFRKVPIPVSTQERLRCGDVIYANAPNGDSKALEFLTTSKQADYSDEQIDVIVRVL